MTTRIDWSAVPEPVRVTIGEQVGGSILHAETVSGGWNSEIAVRVRTAARTTFVKGLRTDHRRVWTQQREAEVGPYVSEVAPRVLWHVEECGWSLVGFEYIDGRHADFSPMSPDLELVADALERLGWIPCPDVPLRLAEQRWAAYVDDQSALDAFRGTALLHTDFNNLNVLVADGRAVFVDWAWATRGAAWIDPALWVIWLIAVGGHTPAQAESWATRVKAWHTASDAAVDAFAVANVKLWREIAGDAPDPWTARMVDAAGLWQAHRVTMVR